MKSGHLRISDIEAIANAAALVASWANHGGTCRGWQNKYVKHAGDTDPILYENIPPGERDNYYCLFDESQCTCGVADMRRIIYGGLRVKDRARLLKGSVVSDARDGFKEIMARNLQLELQVREAEGERDAAIEESRKLRRKLDQVAAAAKVPKVEE